jgi:uncharacterized protein YneF (UPF0154 family)
MSTFLIIFLVLSLIGGLMSRSSGRVEVKESKRAVDPRIKEPPLNKQELKAMILKKGSDKLYAYNNGNQMIELCQEYFNHFGWDVGILEIIITALASYKRFDEAYKYADILCRDDLNYMWGFFFKAEICWYKGQIRDGNRFFLISVEQWEMDQEYVDTRKRELMWEVTPLPTDRYFLDEERKRLQ